MRFDPKSEFRAGLSPTARNSSLPFFATVAVGVVAVGMLRMLLG